MPFHLIVANLFSRKTRLALTVLSIALSVALVVAMTSGFSAFQNASGAFFDKLEGAVDARIGRSGDRSEGLDAAWLDTVRADSRVKTAFARVEGSAKLLGRDDNAPKTGPSAMMTRDPGLVGVDRDSDALLAWLNLNAGRWFNAGEKAAVIDQVTADRFGLAVGETLRLSGQHGQLELPVVGIVHLTAAAGMWGQTKIYVPIDVARPFVFGDKPTPRFSTVSVQFVPDTDADAFKKEWTAKLKEADPKLRFRLVRDQREQTNRNFLGLRLLSSLGGAVAMLAATFIIFSTLTMGVAERQRTLAMLRAIGATRRQIGAMVVGEGLGITLVAIAVGVPLGFSFAAIVVSVLSQALPCRRRSTGWAWGWRLAWR